MFDGVGVALLTLFDNGGAVDLQATAGHAKRLADLGVRSVLVAGTTGEAQTLDDAERAELITAVAEAVDVPVIAGASGSWSRAAAEQVAAARGAGADAVLVHPPRGGGDLPAFFDAVAGAAGGPDRVVGYHNPGPLGVPGIPVEALGSLPFTALKDSSGDPNRLLDELTSWSGSTYVGSSAVLSMAGPLGAAGALLALANVEPLACIKAFVGDAAAQLSLAGLHLDFKRRGLRALKEATAESFGTSTVLRLT